MLQMKSEVKIKKVKEQVMNVDIFPALFKNTNFDYIVLFTDMTSGIVVHSNSEYHDVGEYSDCWISADSSSWEYLGSNVVVKLSNKKLK